MQVDIKSINATSKEIEVIIEVERTEQAYQKYLVKAARSIEIPGFRKGKAPLSMVTKLHSERIKDYFEKDFVDEVFDEVVRENDIHFLLYPEVKELTWEHGSEMKIVFEIEHEPDVEIRQTEGLQVPYRPIELDNEVEKFISELAQKHTTALDVDIAEDSDLLNAELVFELDGAAQTNNVNVYAGTELPQRSFAELTGAKTGDEIALDMTGKQIKLLTMAKELVLDNDISYPCKLMINSIIRYSTPSIDDDFAKDMEFADMVEMRTKVGDDLRLGVEHRNIEGEHSAIVGKIFNDNKFALPPKTLRYVVSEEVEKIDPKYRDMLSQYYIQSIVQEMTTLYILNALKKMMPIEMTDEMVEKYLKHRAILDDMSIGAFKEANKDRLEAGDFKEGAINYAILRKIAQSCEFIEPEEEPEQPTDTEYEEIPEDTDSVKEEA